MTSRKTRIIGNYPLRSDQHTPIHCKCGRRFIHLIKLGLVKCPFCGNVVQLISLKEEKSP